MPQPIWVDLPDTETRRYPIYVGRGLLGRALAYNPRSSAWQSYFVLTDENVAPHWLESLRAGLDREPTVIEVRCGEQHKDLRTLELIWDALESHGADRQALLINLGGGVIGDIGGFAAATYLRGIDFMQVPTTLLAQVDASVGGKVGLNRRNLKNRIGAFAQPRLVICDLDTLTTLDPRQFRSGLAEVIKHGAIGDREFLESVDFAQLTAATPHLDRIVRHSCTFKARIVMMDERETGVRKQLNFGHTVAHALEALALAQGESLLHGEAVAMGMVVAAELSVEVAGLPAEESRQLREYIESAGLPTRLPPWGSTEGILDATATDKKRSGGSVQWTLLSALGNAVHDQRVAPAVVQRVLDRQR